MEIARKSIKYLLFLVALTPLVYTSSLLFPFITGKVLFFRLVVSAALVLFLWLLFQNNDIRCRYFRVLKQPLVILVLIFFVSLVVSTFFAVSPYTAFWSNLERGEGLFMMLHFLAFFLMAATVFEAKDWRTFVKISLIVGLIIAFYGLLQVLGVLELGASGRTRPWSLLGNSSYVGGYFLFILGWAGWLLAPSRTNAPSLREAPQRGATKQSPEIAAAASRPRNDKEIASPSYRDNGGIASVFWRYLAIAAAVVSVIMIFLSATRGAILALLVGVAVWLVYYYFVIANPAPARGRGEAISERLPRSLRSLAMTPPSSLRGRSPKQSLAIMIVIFILFISGFWLTKNQPLWQSVPGFDRLSVLSWNHPTVQTRLLSLDSSWQAFKERPIFGWGPENFIVAYNKHYNPKYALYEAAWFDRAHNKLADVLVMQGLFGILAYLGIFAAAFWYLLRRKIASRHASLAAKGSGARNDGEEAARNDEQTSSSLRAAAKQSPSSVIASRSGGISRGNSFLAILLLMYFVQNLFVFDHTTSYLLFFAALGIIVNLKFKVES